MLDSVLKKLFPCKTILDACAPETGPLLLRYIILKRPSFAIFIHHLMRSDYDRCLHDHPWSFLTWRLGPYIEHTERGAFPRRRFSIGWRPAEFKHRLQMDRPVWTVVLRFRYQRVWGFWPNGLFVAWNKYLSSGCGD